MEPEIKRCLLCVQGINTKQGYLYQEICRGKGKWLFNQFDGNVFDAETDKYFEEKSKGWLSKFANIATLNNWSRLGDIWYFFKNDLARAQVCKVVGRKITMLQSEGFEVSVIAHSLGNLITMCAKDGEKDIEVDNFYSLANPVFIKFRPLRKGWGIPGVIPYVAENMGNFSCNNLIALSSTSDFVSGTFSGSGLKLLDQISNTPVALEWTESLHHQVPDYIELLETEIG